MNESKAFQYMEEAIARTQHHCGQCGRQIPYTEHVVHKGYERRTSVRVYRCGICGFVRQVAK